LIAPDEETVTVYRQEGEPIVLGNEDILTVPELFPGWELPISELWQPIFTLSRNSSIISHFNRIS
jgi:Uma2 family endonuclease